MRGKEHGTTAVNRQRILLLQFYRKQYLFSKKLYLLISAWKVEEGISCGKQTRF